ncbi:MAG: FecR domain-containing protein [Steroidobacteraceae bacterium]
MAQDNDTLLSISTQAAQWWTVFRDGHASVAQRREFAEWMARGPERVEAYLRLARVQSAFERGALRWPETPADQLIRDALAAPEESAALHRSHSASERTSRRRPVMRISMALAASLLVAVCVGWLAWSRPQNFSTEVGEQRTESLEDGSRVTLNTASEVEVRLRKDRRLIRLVKGEALFQVAHDSQRPFDVDAGNVTLRAVGTQFNVDRRAHRTVVTVVEGRVAMLGIADEGKTLPLLSAADRAVIDSEGHSKLEHGIDVAAVTAWLQHQLVFKRRPLGEVIEEFNRYSVRRIEVRSPQLRSEQISGAFQSDDPASVIAFIAGIAGVRIADDGKGNYIVTQDASATRDE